MEGAPTWLRASDRTRPLHPASCAAPGCVLRPEAHPARARRAGRSTELRWRLRPRAGPRSPQAGRGAGVDQATLSAGGGGYTGTSPGGGGLLTRKEAAPSPPVWPERDSNRWTSQMGPPGDLSQTLPDHTSLPGPN